MEFNFEEEISQAEGNITDEVQNIQNAENNNPTELFKDNSENKNKPEESVFKTTKKNQKKLFDDDEDDNDLFDNLLSKPVSKGKK